MFCPDQFTPARSAPDDIAASAVNDIVLFMCFIFIPFGFIAQNKNAVRNNEFAQIAFDRRIYFSRAFFIPF